MRESVRGVLLTLSLLFIISGVSESAVLKYKIYRVAGSGERGYSGDRGPALKAMLNNPRGVALDSAGNIYIADSSNNRIRKIDVKTGIITTIAGIGERGYRGDGGLAVAASLAFPSSVAVGRKGSVYFSDSMNKVVRKVDAKTGIITTLAGIPGKEGFTGDGGPAVKALIMYPTGIAIDKNNNLYFADARGSSIRKVDWKTGIITTVAGKGPVKFKPGETPLGKATLLSPVAVSVGKNGDIYWADSVFNRVKQLHVKERRISILAGEGAMDFSGDGGPADKAKLSEPSGVAVDKDDNVFIADRQNNRIRMIEAKSKRIFTIAGTGAKGFATDGISALEAGLNRPTLLWAADDGSIYFVEPENNVVRRLTPEK